MRFVFHFYIHGSEPTLQLKHWNLRVFFLNETHLRVSILNTNYSHGVGLGIRNSVPPFLRATSHMSRELCPCNGEDPWLSSKGSSMGYGKVVLCSHMPSNIVWSENGPWYMTICIFCWRKRGEDLVWYNMSQTLPIGENYLVVFVCLEFILEFVLEFSLQFVMLEKNY